MDLDEILKRAETQESDPSISSKANELLSQFNVSCRDTVDYCNNGTSVSWNLGDFCVFRPRNQNLFLYCGGFYITIVSLS